MKCFMVMKHEIIFAYAHGAHIIAKHISCREAVFHLPKGKYHGKKHAEACFFLVTPTRIELVLQP